MDNLFEDEEKATKLNCDYSWSDMAQLLVKYNIPHDVIKELSDVQMAIVMKRPMLNIFRFDDYLHDVYGAYENEGKSMKELCKEIFKDDFKTIAYYFGVSD